MNTQEIIEGNKLIAEFCGSKAIYTDHSEYNEDGSMKYDFNGDGSPWIIETWTKPDWFSEENLRIFGWGSYNMLTNMLYHSSWDWLMPVVEKIEKEFCKEFEVIIHSASCYINKWDSDKNTFNTFISGFGKKIEAVYMACVEFIKWYNNQTNETHDNTNRE